MNPSGPAKLGMAFAAGVALALGGSLFFFHQTAEPAATVTQPLQGAHTKAPLEISPFTDEAPIAKPAQPAEPEHKKDAEVDAAATDDKEPAPAKSKTVAVVTQQASRPTFKKVHKRYALLTPQGSFRVEVSQMKPSLVRVQELTPEPMPVAPMPVAPAPMPAETPTPVAEAAPRAPEPHVVTLPAGTNLAIRLNETLSTDHNYSGDTFRATLDAPIISDGFIIAERGSKVLGKVVSVDKAGRMQGTAALQLAVSEIRTTDGQRIRVETTFFRKTGPNNGNQELAKIAGGAALGAIIGAIAGGGRGAAIGAGAGGATGTGAVFLDHPKPAVLPTETRLAFQLASPVTITEQLN